MLFLRPVEAFPYSDNAGQGRVHPKATADFSSQKAEIYVAKMIRVTKVSQGVARELRPLCFPGTTATSIFIRGCEISGQICSKRN